MSQAPSSKLTWRAPLLVGLLLSCSAAAMAQWQWIDGTGRKVFSDTPPPASIPDKSILKKPGSGLAPMQVNAEPTSAAAPTAAPAAAQAPARDTELEARKKQAEQAEEAKRKADMERQAKARADSCERARKAKSTMESGVRLATTNAKGEREIMDDKAKAAETQRMEAIIRSDCGPLPKQ
jgi:type IV secretory pathway VirB10-like protein